MKEMLKIENYVLLVLFSIYFYSKFSLINKSRNY